MTIRSPHIRMAFLAMLLCFAFMFPVQVFSEQGTRQQSPVWMWDYRDTFYDIAFINKQKAVIVGARGQILVSHGKYESLWSPRDSKTKEPTFTIEITAEDKASAIDSLIEELEDHDDVQDVFHNYQFS